MNKKLLLWAVIFFFCVPVLFYGIMNVENTEVIKIGVAVPLTGNNGFAGEGIRNAIMLAQSELGSTKYKYEVIFEDTQVDPKAAMSVVKKMIEIDNVDAIIDAYAPIGVTISPITEREEIVHIGIAFDPRAAEGKYNFINFTTPDTAVRKFLSEMNVRGLNTLGVFHLNNPGILAVNEALVRLSPEYGVKILDNQEIQPGERDFRSVILRAIKTEPQIYAILSITPEMEILTKQMMDLGIKKLTTIIYFETSPDKKLFEGLWSVGFGQASNVFQEKYKEKFKSDLSWAAPNAYDSFNIIVKAAETYKGEGKPPVEFIAEQIQNLEGYRGVLGDLTVDERGIIDSSVQIKVVKNGQLVPAEM
jgi:branched-chain amino acid transport system substrate-binding protein